MKLITHQIFSFLAIVEHGSLTAAADKLGINKSSVTEHLQQLEASLQVKLLNRTTRRQNLTPTGKKFYERCVELHHLSANTLEEISEGIVEASGKLCITAPNAIVNSLVAPAIGKLLTQSPKIEPELIVTDERLNLMERNIDLALTIGDLPDSSYIAKRITTFTENIFISTDLLDTYSEKPDELSVDHLPKELAYIMQKWERNTKKKLPELPSSLKDKFAVNNALAVDSIHAVRDLILNNVGIGLLPELFVKEEINAKKLTPLFPDSDAKEVPIYAVHPYGRKAPLAVKQMINTLLEQQ